MMARFLADAVLLLHLGFIVWVGAGGLAVLRWPRLAFLHLPAVLWGAGIEFTGAICPLTPLENALRRQAGEAGYAGGFIEHYLLPLIYPDALTETVEWLLGALVLAINGPIYWMLWRRSSTLRR
ncbi:MAG: DUF2784 domain-containing protein [Burkholderiales bacterium]|jgi:hypothetical protein|nr:DUF2784 domain-containing protein [Burkholderiales bacterium]